MVVPSRIGTTVRAVIPRWVLAWPTLIWWLVLFVVPLAWIATYSFGQRPVAGQVGPVSLDSLSLDNYKFVFSDAFFSVFIMSIRTAALGTFICAIIGLPVAYTLAFIAPSRWRPFLVFLLILPYWTSFLLRTFAWRIILAPNGTLSNILQDLGLVSGNLLVLDTGYAVQLGIVYNYLPAMILPMYVALERVNPELMRASKDLGAGRFATFWNVVLPLAAPGLIGGAILTFILAAGDYVVPTILGGTKGLMVGNLIATQILASQNLPAGAAMAVLLVLMIASVIVLFVITLGVLGKLARVYRGGSL